MCTVDEHLSYLFPRGLDYSETLSAVEKGQGSLTEGPVWPPDMFGAMASLVNLSGAYHHVKFNPDAKGSRLIKLEYSDRQEICQLAEEWRTDIASIKKARLPEAIREKWQAFLETASNQSVFARRLRNEESFTWWKSAVVLMLIADEACRGVGYNLSEAPSWVEKVVVERLHESRHEFKEVYSLNLLLNRDAVCVTPKSSHPDVGCTMRSLTQHMALAPAQGVARANWFFHPASSTYENDDALNLLLVPYPYKITSNSFRGGTTSYASSNWFHMQQLWLPPSHQKATEFCSFLRSLIEEAERDGTKIGGIVFPELALSPQYLTAIFEYLRTNENIRLFVAGTSKPIDEASILPDILYSDRKVPNVFTGQVSSLRHESGNYVTTYARFPNSDGKRKIVVSFRQKHHWWILDRSQIETYAIGDVLDPSCSWSEAIELHSRSIDVFSISKALTFTSLICEDLARIDPCQQLVRSIGPNLVFALLMDGPQLTNRWSSKYATVLAEDPGSAVLTLTSKGLIARQNEAESFPPSNAVALWCDSFGQRKTLNLWDDAQAILLKLRAQKTQSPNAFTGADRVRHAWRYVGHAQVRAPKEIAAPWVGCCGPENETVTSG